jgi:TonB family protein
MTTTGKPGTNQPQKKNQTFPGSSPRKKVLVLKLYLKGTDKKEKVFKFDKERIVIGSVVSADIKLSGEGVSPIHAVLERNEKSGKVLGTLFDLASDTGVFVNDKKIVAHELSDHDQIIIGRHRLNFSTEEIDKNLDRERTRKSGDRTLYLNPNEDFTPLLLEDEREVVEIFDYRPSSKRALEGVMSWYGVILTVEHFVSEKKITIGNTPKSDFAIPPLLSSSHYPIVVQRGGAFILNIDSQMKGVIHHSGELRNLDEVRGTTMRGPNGYEVPIGNNDFAKISIGEIDFYFSFTAAPPRLKMRKLLDRDPFFQKIFYVSMILTAVAIFSLMKMEVPKSIEAEQVPERIATILYQPEKFINPPPVQVKPTPRATPAPVPKETPKTVVTPPPQKPAPKVVVTPKAQLTHRPIPKEMKVTQKIENKVPVKTPEHSHSNVQIKTQPKEQPKVQPKTQPKEQAKASVQPSASNMQAKEGEGARAKGKEGSRGDPTSQRKSSEKMTEINRPSPHAGSKGASGQSQVKEEGSVDFLKGAGGRIQNILGNSAAKFGEGGKELKGFGNFSTHGNGGLALSGTGAGGGGDAETTLGGLGKKGTGMGRVGTGKGAAGNGNGIVGSQARMAIRTGGPEETVVMGAIDRDAIAAAIYAHRDEFRLCYEREINAETPSLSGTVNTNFVIGASGRVTQAGVESSSLGNQNAERCVLSVLKRIDFPIPNGGGIVEVRFPFKFSAIGK